VSTIVCVKTVAGKAGNFNSVQTAGIAVGMQCLVNGLKELNYAYEKDQQIVGCDNQIQKVKLLITTLEGKKIGVVENDNNLDFIVSDVNCAITTAAIKKIKQRYSKYSLLHELEAKGYAKIKEERLPNGKIRMIVERTE
jgi:hypothetical protein